MSLATKPVLIFVHGAWHNTKTWDGVRASLENQDFETCAYGLLATGVRDPVPQSHIEDVVELQKMIRANAEKSKDTVLIGHSYGGMSVSGATEGFEKKPGEREYGVIGCIFVAAFMCRVGENAGTSTDYGRKVWGFGIGKDEFEFMDGKFEYYRCKTPHERFYNDLSAEEAKPWIDMLTWQAIQPAQTKAETEAWRFVPCTMVYCLQDNIFFLPLQKHLVEKASEVAKYPIKTYEIDSSHSPWIRHLPELVKDIAEAAEQHTLNQLQA